jgi:hypothetical protein
VGSSVGVLTDGSTKQIQWAAARRSSPAQSVPEIFTWGISGRGVKLTMQLRLVQLRLY